MSQACIIVHKEKNEKQQQQAIHVLLFLQKGNFNKMSIYSPFSKNSICFVAKTIDNKNVATGRKS